MSEFSAILLSVISQRDVQNDSINIISDSQMYNSQYIIINLSQRRVELYSQPVPDKGQYADKRIISAKEKLSLPTGTSKRLPVPLKQLLP